MTTPKGIVAQIEEQHGKLLTTREASQYLGVSTRTMECWRNDKKNPRGPAYVRTGSGCSTIVKYALGDLQSYADENVCRVVPGAPPEPATAAAGESAA